MVAPRGGVVALPPEERLADTEGGLDASAKNSARTRSPALPGLRRARERDPPRPGRRRDVRPGGDARGGAFPAEAAPARPARRARRADRALLGPAARADARRVHVPPRDHPAPAVDGEEFEPERQGAGR